MWMKKVKCETTYIISGFFNVYVFFRERDCKQGRDGEGSGDRGSKVGFVLTAEIPMQGSDSLTKRS